MSEIHGKDTHTTSNSLQPEQPHLDQDAIAERSAVEMKEAAQKLRMAQEGWLERRGVLEDTSRFTMTRREFELLKDIGLGDSDDMTSFLINKTKRNYDIPLDSRYVSVDIVSTGTDVPLATKVVAVHEEDFGTVTDDERLERQGIERDGMPRITMDEREFGLFGVAGLDGSDTPSLVKYARDLYGVPQDDQYDPQYALIDIESDDSDLPNEPLLVIINEEDFGMVIDREVIDKDNDYLNHGSDPDSPLNPESSDKYITVDITETIIESQQGLQTFAETLMSGELKDPFDSSAGDIGVRAGGLAFEQQDAYIWTDSPFAKSVELTLAFPGQYDSVCIVRGQRREAANGKVGMAQIEKPTEVLKIEGENLRRLQEAYSDLYNKPDFILTKEQKRERDEVFNDYLVHQISQQASKNKMREQHRRDEEYSRQQSPLQARQMPRS